MNISWILSGFADVLTFPNLVISFIGCFLGNLIGLLPGLGPTAGVALLFPFMLTLPPLSVIICLGSVYYGSMYGGSISAVLLNIPGVATAAPTALDGYPLARQGRAGSTLLICALSSFVGSIVALICVAFFGPILARFALSFGPFEYFGLMFFSLACACGLTGDSILKGLAAAIIGILISLIGIDSSTNAYRLTFGSYKLLQGLDQVAIVVGVFGIAEVLKGIKDNAVSVAGSSGKLQNFLPSKRELKLSAGAALRGSVIGTILGIFPGITPSSSTFIAYSLNKKLSVEKDKIGKGGIEGCACAEAANNSSAVSGFIPLLALGIPTGPVLAIVLAALIIQGVIPGPLMFSVHLDLTAAIIAGFFIGNLIMLLINIPLINLWVKITTIPYKWLAPVILFLCMLGTLVIRYSTFDLIIMIVFGIIGLIAKKAGFPIPPFVLGLILGKSIENYFRQAAILGFDKITSHPMAIGAVLLGLVLLVIFAVFKDEE